MYLPEMLLVSASWVCFWLKMEPGEKVDILEHICLTSLTRAKCGVRSTLCWKIPNISGSIELFAL